ncbi:MAG: hypothetical protein ACE5NW_04930 [Acidiferrobacterales bacterium]
MTEVNDKQKHKPSPKHTLEEVRKSLEDLVRNQLDDAAADTDQVDAPEPDQPANQAASTPTGSVPLRSRHRRHRPETAGLDTDQVLTSLKDLLGSELGDVQDDQATAAPGAGEVSPLGYTADEPELPFPEGLAEAPSDTTAEILETADRDDATHALTTDKKEMDSAPMLPDSGETDSAGAASVDDIEVGALEAQAAPEIDASVDISATVDADAHGATPGAPAWPTAADSGAPEMSADEAMGDESTIDESPALPEDRAPPGDEAEEITLVEAPAADLDTPPPSTSIGDMDGGASEALELEGPVATPPAAGDEVKSSESSEDTPSPAATRNGALPLHTRAATAIEPTGTKAPDSETPIASATEAHHEEPSQPELPASAAPPEIIAISSPASVQQAFIFEDPVLTATWHTSQIQVASEHSDMTERDETARAAASEAPESDGPEAARQPDDSELVLEEGEADAEAAVASSLEPEEPASIEVTAPLVDDASAAGGIEVSESVSSDLNPVDDESIAGDDSFEYTEDVTATLNSMDALEIPGGEQLSAELTKPKPTPASDATPEDALVVEPSTEPTEITESLEPDELAKPKPTPASDATPEDALVVEPSSEPSEITESLELEEPVTPAPANEPERPAGQTPDLGAQTSDTDSDTGEETHIAAAPSGSTAKKVLTAVVDAQDESLNIPSVDFNDDLSVGDEDSDAREPSVSMDEQSRKPEPASAENVLLVKPGEPEQTVDSEFVELGDPIAKTGKPAKTPGATLEDSIRARAQSTKSASARFGQDRKTEHTGRARKSAVGSIPVLRDVVAQPQFEPTTEQQKKRPVSPTGDKAADKRALEKKAVRLKSNKPRKAARGVARNMAVQVIAKLNMELRKCGERALSPAIIDRLQLLLREALEQQTANRDNNRNKK